VEQFLNGEYFRLVVKGWRAASTGLLRQVSRAISAPWAAWAAGMVLWSAGQADPLLGRDLSIKLPSFSATRP